MSDGDTELSDLHERLKAHFTDLRAQRSKIDDAAPIFALEHGLAEFDLAALNTKVRNAVRLDHISEAHWLPLVVYAAEVGYEYSGDEYWQTFEARTPGWAEHGDRHYIRDKFQAFGTAFQGAQPTGRWAGQFSIISWPITHAVLPTDLQRHLARLLFDYRRGLTAELLANSKDLGRRLASRSLYTSSRFQNFAQNSDLLGLVAVSLLIGSEADSPYLLGTTLTRIVADLTRERDSERLLREAKRSASRIRMRGFEPVARNSDAERRPPSARLPSAADPSITLRFDATWNAYLEVPDVSALAERLPVVVQEAAKLRAVIDGYRGPPLARGQLLYPGRQLRLEDWPTAGAPLIQLENGSAQVNSLLADQSVISPGPVWVFARGEDYGAHEVRGKTVRPGQRYILLSRTALVGRLPSWISPTNCGIGGVHAYSAEPPPVLGSEDVVLLAPLGLGLLSDIRIRPAGLVPAAWDGEGVGEWIAGEEPVLAIRSGREFARCLVRVDDDPAAFAWPALTNEIFLLLSDLQIGSHRVDVSLFPAGHEASLAEGSVALIIRPPSPPRLTGTSREGMYLAPNPVNPTLTELWVGTALLEVLGPSGARVRVDLDLADDNGAAIARSTAHAVLPVVGEDWANLGSQLRDDERIRRHYDDSESATIKVSHPELGVVALRCDRPFEPLRWKSRRDATGPYLILVNHTGETPRLEVMEFVYPNRPLQPSVGDDGKVRWPHGGLVTAHAGTAEAAIILSPVIHRPTDLQAILAQPIGGVIRSAPEIRKLIVTARRWARATLPGDPMSSLGRSNVQQAIANSIADVICGGRWAQIERMARESFDEIRTSQIEHAMGDAPYQRSIARDLLRQMDELVALPPRRRAERVRSILGVHAPFIPVYRGRRSLAEFAMRLASEPSSLLEDPTELEQAIDVLLDSPTVLRACRFVVLAIHATGDQSAGATYRGWMWA